MRHNSSSMRSNSRSYRDELKEKDALLKETSDENRKQYSEILERRNTEKTYARRNEYLVGRLDDEKKRVSDLQVQMAAINELRHQQAETRKLEIELHQHGQGMQPTYKMDRKPQEHQFQVTSQTQQMNKLKDEPKTVGYGNMKEMVKKQEAEYRRKGLEQKKTFQDQLSHKTERKQPVKQEPETYKEELHQRHQSHDQPASEEDSDGGTETPSEDDEEESEDTQHRIENVMRKKAPDNKYHRVEQKQSGNRKQKDPDYADDPIMKRYMSDADDNQSLPYGPDHWSTDAVTPTRPNDGNKRQQDNNHQQSGRQSNQVTRNNKGSERQFRPQWQEPPKPSRVTNATRYQHQGWRSTLPQGNRTRNADQQSSYSGDSGQGGHHHHHHHGHQHHNQRNQGNRQGHQRGRQFGNGFQGRHPPRERDNSDEGSQHGRGFHRDYGHRQNRERDYGDQGYQGYQRKNPKLSNYDGRISFRAYEVKLNRMAQQYQWTDDEKLSKFVEALQDKALQFYGNLPEDVRDDYELVSKKFRARFWPQEPSQTVRSQLKVLKQQPEETLEEYAEKCQQLATDAWGATQSRDDGTVSHGCISSWIARHRSSIQCSGQGTSKSGRGIGVDKAGDA